MGNNNIIVGILVLVVIALVGWFAYSQGYFTGNADNEQDIEINLPGGENSGNPSESY